MNFLSLVFTLFFSHFQLIFWALSWLLGMDMRSYLIILVESNPLYACFVLGFLCFPLYKTKHGFVFWVWYLRTLFPLYRFTCHRRIDYSMKWGFVQWIMWLFWTCSAPWDPFYWIFLFYFKVSTLISKYWRFWDVAASILGFKWLPDLMGWMLDMKELELLYLSSTINMLFRPEKSPVIQLQGGILGSNEVPMHWASFSSCIGMSYVKMGKINVTLVEVIKFWIIIWRVFIMWKPE